MRAVLLISLLLVASMLSLAAAAHSASRAVERRPPIALEQPGDPPGLRPPRPPRRFARSTVTYSRGPWVSVQANVDEFGNNIPNDAANEPSIAVNPNDPSKMAIGWRQFDTIESSFRQAGWGYSQDGGQSWTFPGVIEPTVFRSDPVLGFDSEGNFYYYSLTINPWEGDLYKSVDGGQSWDKGVYAFGGDKAWMTLDRSGGIGHGHIYAYWAYAFSCCEGYFTRSTDGGLSFMEPIEIPSRPVWGTLSVGPAGAMYLVGISEYNTSAFVVAKSTNAQDAGQAVVFDFVNSVNLGGSMSHGADPNPGGLSGQVWVATDHSGGATHGNVYMLASVNPPGSDPLDVKIIRSTDGGQNWSSPIRVNDDPLDPDSWQWFGTMSVAPNGRIDAIWNDTRAAGQANISELYYAYSTDAGDTWSPNMPVSPSFDSHVGWPQQDKLGDYYDMISDVASVRIAYAATFNDEQDVYYLRLGDCDDNGIHDGEEIAGGAPDDNANGILDVCESGACCLGDGACADELEVACLAAGGVYQGDGIECGAVECAPFGACCASDGACDDLQSPADCAAADGLYQGDSTDCASAKCVPFGACCTAQGGCLDDQTEAGCLAAGGLYQNDGTDCDSVDCAPFGACCLPDESCLGQITVSLCDTAGGSYQGDGSLCSDADCTIPTGACCMGDFSCNENVPEDDCGAAGGTYLGDGSDCTDCSEEPVACCDLTTGECVGDLGPLECVALGYEPQDAGTNCASTECPIILGACCLTDGGCDDAISIPECEAAAGIFQGDGVICAEVECDQPPTGACCLESGECLEGQTSGACTLAGGDYAGDGVNCIAADCPPPTPTGSCCLNDSVCVPDVTADACTAADGVYLGDGSDCSFCSVFPQACCAPITGDCADQPPAQCIDQGLEPQGPDTNCDDNGCPMPLGACCFDTGLCLELNPKDCSGLAGTWQGAKTICDAADCGVAGACCLSNESCLEINGETCLDIDGTYIGDGTSCDDADCSAQIGACCLAGGGCLDDHTSAACAAAGGEYQGHGSTCASANCPQDEVACCFDTGFCLDLSENDCSELGGVSKGPGTSCIDAECGVTGACCLADDKCLEVNAETCADLEGAYGGDGSACGPDSCVVTCPEDLDGDGEIGPFDLALVLGLWGPCEQPCAPGPPETTCQTDLDGDCVTGPFDLALILGFWGPCE